MPISSQKRVEAAASRALKCNAASYQSVKSILKKGLDRLPLADALGWAPPIHSNIRGRDYYQNPAAGDPLMPCACAPIIEEERNRTMLIEQTMDKLYGMKLDGMAESLKEQMANPRAAELSFEDHISLMVDRQWDLKETRGLRQRLQVAKLRQQAAVEDIGFRTHRGPDKAAMLSLSECSFIRSQANIVITGPTGVGKTYIACAIAQKACRLKYSVRYFGCGNLLSATTLARADGSFPSLLRRLEKTELLVIDDWGMYPLDAQGAKDVFEILEGRSGRGSTMIVSQIPVANWYDMITGPTTADAILDRLVHNAYRIEMKGESMRKKLSPPATGGP